MAFPVAEVKALVPTVVLSGVLGLSVPVLAPLSESLFTLKCICLMSKVQIF